MAESGLKSHINVKLTLHCANSLMCNERIVIEPAEGEGLDDCLMDMAHNAEFDGWTVNDLGFVYGPDCVAAMRKDAEEQQLKIEQENTDRPGLCNSAWPSG